MPPKCAPPVKQGRREKKEEKGKQVNFVQIVAALFSVRVQILWFQFVDISYICIYFVYMYIYDMYNRMNMIYLQMLYNGGKVANFILGKFKL